MYISLDWVKDFIKIPTKIKPEEIAEELTKHTVEVEKILKQSDLYNNVVVGEVLEVAKHPNADRLKVAVVDVKNEKLKIVCGAPNIKGGQKVAVALVDAVLPNGLEIKEAEIRGEKSFGMVCAEDELGLGKDHDGILVLNKSAKIGQEFSKYLKSNDMVLEIDNKSLSNRPDLLSHYGIAREIGAIFDIKLKEYKKLSNNDIKFTNEKLDVKIEDKTACLRYMAVKITGIEVKESPSWLKERLIAVNQKPINNIVDITNYVMLETGQPLHAFDAKKVDKIIIRKANKEESIESLDGKERVLNENDLVITDGEKPIAIAGIIGGSNSEVDNNTIEILLESANFQATSVRKTSQRLGLRTEASTRFEKTLDPSLPEQALNKAIRLIKEDNKKAEISSELIDINNFSIEEKIIELDLKWLEKKIGQKIPINNILQYLNGLGFIVEDKKAEVLKVTVPSWRATKDVSIREDLIEEILRLYGYDKIKSQIPNVEMSLPKINKERVLERKIKNILALKYKLSESYNYSFLGKDQLKKLKIDFSQYLRLINPLSDIHGFLRQSLAPNLISSIKTNQANNDKFGFFEIGRVYLDVPGAYKKNKEGEEMLPYQSKHLGIVLAGKDFKVFTELKSVITGLFQSLIGQNIEVDFSFLENGSAWADKKTITQIIVNKQEIGTLTMVSKEVSNNLNLKKKVAVVEINFDDLVKFVFSQEEFKFEEVVKFPPVIRDLAFVVDKEVLYNDLKRELVEFNKLIKSVELFDVYEGTKLEDNKKSLAFHLYYQSEEKTLTTEEVDEIEKKLIEHLMNKFSAKLRNF